MLINTFQQNDFFNVFYSHDQKVSLVEPCLQKLMQATNRNKEMIKEKVDQLPEPYGEANNTGLFREAFEMFNKSLDEDTSSSGCTKALMFISDGTEKTDEYDSIIQSYKKYVDVVVFTYFVGFGSCKDMMSDLAVQNGGAMYEFPTLGIPKRLFHLYLLKYSKAGRILIRIVHFEPKLKGVCVCGSSFRQTFCSKLP